MNVLVLGGTGAMGKHLVDYIANDSNRVVVTSRTQKGFNGNIEYKTGDAKETYFIDGLLTQYWDVIIDFMVYKTDEFQARYHKFLSSTDHYIYLSSARVYADSNQPLTENSPRLLDVTKDQVYLATDEYALTKARQENLLFSSLKKNWTIIRPYITYDEERLQLGVLEKEDWLYRAIKGRSILFSSDINNKLTTLTSGRDVARGIAAIIGATSAHGEVFHITSDVNIYWKEILDIYMNTLETHLGYRTNVILQDLESFITWRGGRYQITCDRLYNRCFDNSKINQYIDTSSFIRPQVGLEQCLKRFIDSNDTKFKALNWKAEANKDRILHERTSLLEIPRFKQKIKYCVFRYLKSS